MPGSELNSFHVIFNLLKKPWEVANYYPHFVDMKPESQKG